MQRKTLAILVALTGIVGIVTVFGNQMFTASSSWERLSDDLRPFMTEQTVQGLRANADGLTAVNQEFSGKVLPTIAQATGLSPDQLTSRFAGDFPATARGVLAVPQIVSNLNSSADRIESQVGNFRDADAIPTTDGSSTAVPWFILITAVAALALGGWMLRPGRLAPALAVLVGVIMVATPLITSLVSKSGSSDDLNTAFRPVFTAEHVAENREGIQVLTAMGAELQTKLVPTLATQLSLSTAQTQGFIASNFPAVAAAGENLAAGLALSTTLTDAIEGNLDEFADVSRPSYVPIAWTVLAAGFAAILFAGFALWTNEAAIAAEQARRSERLHRAA